MASTHCYASAILAALTTVLAYDVNKEFRCTVGNTVISGLSVCNGVNDCPTKDPYRRHYYEHFERLPGEDESTDVCAPEDMKLKTVDLNSLTHPNGSLLFSWTWRDGRAPRPRMGYYLGGYYLHGSSPEHTFQITLSPLLTSYSADYVRGYTEYEFTLRPFYKNRDQPAGSVYLAKATTHAARTPASAPGAPSAIVALPPTSGQRQGELAVTISGPMAWNSKPLGYRVRWEPADPLEVARRDFDLDDTADSVLRRTYDQNITLTLKPGRECTLFVSARGLGDFGEVLVGPETSAVVGTAPLAPIGLSAQVADPTKIILAWSAASPVARFVVNLTEQKRAQEDVFDAALQSEKINLDLVDDILLDGVLPAYEKLQGGEASKREKMQNVTFSLDGSTRESSAYKLPVFGLMPSSEYAVRVKACAAKACSEETSTVFRTPPAAVPRVVVTSIFSNDSSSVHLEWNFTLPRPAPELNPEFEVKVKKNGSYRVIRTVEKRIAIGNLSSGTDYEVEVQPSLEMSPGKREYGHATAATISTWPLVPLAPTLSLDGFRTAPDLVAVSWTFFNSSVTHVEVATNQSSWAKCDGTSNCDFTVLHGWNASFKTGFVKISGLDPYETYVVGVKGCNQHGCGAPTTVNVSTAESEPSEPVDLSLNATEDLWGYLTWNAPERPAGPLSGYIVSWLCEHGDQMAARTRDTSLLVSDLPSDGQECTFSVSAYNVAKAGRELRGKPATLTTRWPKT
ncbi:uncharacterized protein LOC144152539 [Haemaphysalis longicornis]